jgi:hypothetical protein
MKRNFLNLWLPESIDTEIYKKDISAFKKFSNKVSENIGYFFADVPASQETKENEVEVEVEISDKPTTNFINNQPVAPSTDGYINDGEASIDNLKKLLTQYNLDHSFDKNDRLQLTQEGLKELDTLVSEGKINNIKISDMASVILSFRPNPLYFLEKEYPGVTFRHVTATFRQKEKESENEEHSHIMGWHRTIEVYGGYLNDRVVERLGKEIGLTVLGYNYTFYINPAVISKYDPKVYILPEMNAEDSSFTFFTNLRIATIDENDHKWDFDLKYTYLKKFFESLFGAENVRFESKFIYFYDLFKFENEYLQKRKYERIDLCNQINDAFFGESNISISENLDKIGLDFNWREESINDVLLKFIHKCPFLNFIFYKNHRYNVDFKIESPLLDEMEKLLQEKFPSMQIKRNDKKGTLYFYQPARNGEDIDNSRIYANIHR